MPTEYIFTDDNFQKEVIEASQEKPVLVDFWAAWCGPCQMMAPIISEIAEEYKDKIKVGKLNVDENRKTAAQYNIMSIPTLNLYKKGQVLNQLIGVQPKETIKSIIDQALSS
jgi:thioredoxin 1